MGSDKQQAGVEYQDGVRRLLWSEAATGAKAHDVILLEGHGATTRYKAYILIY